MGDVTPDQIATFDQALADAENNLDVLIDLWRTGDPDSPEHIRIAGLCVALGERPEWDRIALAEHLTVAIRRLDRAGQAATPDGPRRWALPDDRERAKAAIHRPLHDLNVRIVGLAVGDCHCNLIAEVVLDALTDATPAADGQDGDGRG